MNTPTPAAPNPTPTTRRTGPISTAEIKTRIEAMFPDDRHRPRPTR
ncbi:hypothetical protein ACFWAY_47055 [Rhodococcus sp. NPDC059968]